MAGHATDDGLGSVPRVGVLSLASLSALEPEVPALIARARRSLDAHGFPVMDLHLAK